MKNQAKLRSTNSQKILITGGCGFIGVNLVRYFIKKGFNYIRILDNLSIGKKKDLEDALRENGKITSTLKNNEAIYEFKDISCENIKNKFIIELIIGDIRSYEICLKTTENIDTVVHLAAQPGVIPSIEDPFYNFEVNVQGTLNLLYAAVKNKVNGIVFASSNAPLGKQNPPMNEKKAPQPLSPYGASKLACEGYCSAFHGSYGIKTVSLRFSNVYGPYCIHKNSVIAKFIKDGILKGKLTIYGDGHQTRDFIHVKDICQAIYLSQKYLILKSSNPNKIWGNVFHLGSGKETTILKIATLIQKSFNKKIEICFVPDRKGEIKRNYSSITKSKKILGFFPQICLKDGVQEVYDWLINKDIDEIKKAVVSAGNE